MNAGVHPDSVNGASFYAVAAVDTKKRIDLIAMREFFNLRIAVLSCFNVDTARRASGSAQETRSAFHVSVLFKREAMPPSIACRIGPTLVGVLNASGGRNIAAQSEKMKAVESKISHQLTKREAYAFCDLNQVEAFQERHFFAALHKNFHTPLRLREGSVLISSKVIGHGSKSA